ncbi:MAG: carboxypeptidase regulatory-like domain-containing protein [Acidobacteria bacterium]|nr:carboxypeptidase regulatory-like domain-containing protein [Acidobacteriota bacterium]
MPLLHCAAALLPLLAEVSVAQQYSRLTGIVTDPAGEAMPGAAISVVSEETGFRRTTTSFDNGSYSVASLQPGLYKMTVRKPGFPTLVRLGVKLDVAHTARVDF